MERVKFGFWSAAEAEREIEKHKSLRADLEALEKVHAALDIYEFLGKNPEIKTWGVVLKHEFSDELESGVYGDYTTEEKADFCPVDDKYAYMDDLDWTELHDDLNKVLDGHRNLMLDMPYGEYAADRAGMLAFIKDFAGEEYANRVSSEADAEALDRASGPGSGSGKRRKM